MVFLDQWWNELGKPAQMADRIYRIGQTKETHIIHLRLNHTIEDNIKKVHDRKNKIISLTQETKEGRERQFAEIMENPDQCDWLKKPPIL